MSHCETFYLHARGEKCYLDLGADSYNLPDYNSTYRVRTEGHNVMVFNPGREYGQKFGGQGRIIDCQFGQDPNEGVKKLAIHFEEIRTCKLSVSLSVIQEDVECTSIGKMQ